MGPRSKLRQYLATLSIAADQLPLASTFTDGAGMAHQSLLDRCAKVLKYKGKLSAVQIRIGGIKGVLCAASLDADIEEDEVRIRGSQVKFESRHKTLNIVKVRRKGACLRMALITSSACVVFAGNAQPPSNYLARIVGSEQGESHGDLHRREDQDREPRAQFEHHSGC